MGFNWSFNALNTKLNSICHLLALLGAHPILHVSRIKVKVLKHIQHNLPCSYNGVGSFSKTFIFVRTKLIELTVYVNQCLFAYRIVRSGFQECMKI
jgi:hypothetical protein